MYLRRSYAFFRYTYVKLFQVHLRCTLRKIKVISVMGEFFIHYIRLPYLKFFRPLLTQRHISWQWQHTTSYPNKCFKHQLRNRPPQPEWIRKYRWRRSLPPGQCWRRRASLLLIPSRCTEARIHKHGHAYLLPSMTVLYFKTLLTALTFLLLCSLFGVLLSHPIFG